MKTFRLIAFLLFAFSIELISQSPCEQYIYAIKKASDKKRSFRMTSQITGDKNVNYTEFDTLGHIHFWGHVGSLNIESFYADGKRYSKIQSEYVKDDEWTFQEVKLTESSLTKQFDLLKNDAQISDCQIIGEESIKKKNYKIATYSIQKNMPKRNSADSFLMEIKVKTWFNVSDSTIQKYEYETTTERLSQTIKSTLEYDVDVKIELPKNAKFEAPKQILLTQTSVDTLKKEVKPATFSIENSNKTAAKPTDTTKANTLKIAVSDSIQAEKDTTTVFTQFDQTPEYKEGMTALLKYINNNMHYPETARKEGIDGTVNVGFIIETDGKLSHIHIKRGLHPDIDSEAKRIVESMSGAWKAGKIGGKDVRSAYTLPLKFEIRE